MWNYLKGLLRIGLYIPLESWFLGAWGLLYLAVFFVGIVGWFVDGTFPESSQILASIFVFLIPGILCTRSSLKKIKLREPIPYWGEIFGRDRCIKLLAEDRFSPYVFKNGRKCYAVQVSKSGRWVRISGRYYPIPLIKSFSTDNGNYKFIMINGQEVPIVGIPTGKKGLALRELIPPMTSYVNDVSEADNNTYNKDAFKKAWFKSLKNLAGADWFEVRYRWEKMYAEILSDVSPVGRIDNVIKAADSDEALYKQMFDRVMSDDEIKIVAQALRDNKLEKPDVMFDIANYSDEFCVDNGIKVLSAIGYPANKEWIGYLFDCLKDIQKSYCDDAVLALKANYPREELIKHIDTEIVKAHEASDLLWAAGLISLAKAIEYEISLEEDKADKDKEKEVSTCGTI